MYLCVEKERSNETYKSSVSDVQKLVCLSNGLLALAKANYNQTEISFKALRLDELILDARNDALHDQPGCKIDIRFKQEIEEDDFISVLGNEYLLRLAFKNLMENSCKFSKENESVVSINYSKTHVIVTFRDQGVGIHD